MGDRANVYVHAGDAPGVYLYTHWNGTLLPATVAHALERGKSRWEHEQYLARIIFCEMVQGFERELNGFGISAAVGDGEDRIIDVDTEKLEVTIGGVALPFSDFIAAFGHF